MAETEFVNLNEEVAEMEEGNLNEGMADSPHSDSLSTSDQRVNKDGIPPALGMAWQDQMNTAVLAVGADVGRV